MPSACYQLASAPAPPTVDTGTLFCTPMEGQAIERGDLSANHIVISIAATLLGAVNDNSFACEGDTDGTTNAPAASGLLQELMRKPITQLAGKVALWSRLVSTRGAWPSTSSSSAVAYRQFSAQSLTVGTILPEDVCPRVYAN